MSRSDLHHGDSETVCFSCGHPGPHRDGYDCVKAERDRLVLAANSARVLIERHCARHGSNDLLTTALRELDDVLPTYQEGAAS